MQVPVPSLLGLWPLVLPPGVQSLLVYYTLANFQTHRLQIHQTLLPGGGLTGTSAGSVSFSSSGELEEGISNCWGRDVSCSGSGLVFLMSLFFHRVTRGGPASLITVASRGPTSVALTIKAANVGEEEGRSGPAMSGGVASIVINFSLIYWEAATDYFIFYVIRTSCTRGVMSIPFPLSTPYEEVLAPGVIFGTSGRVNFGTG